MKKICLLVMFALFVSSGICCLNGAGRVGSNPQKKENKKVNKKQLEMEAIANCIEKDSLTIFIDKIRPSFAANVNEQSYDGYTGQTLLLANGKLSMNFIYIGEVPTAMMGDRNISLYAKEQKVEVHKSKDEKTGKTNYYTVFRNERAELERISVWECFIEIQPNGRCHITMQTQGLNPMIYQGFMDVDIKKKKR